jgi:hypothetical protein
MRSFLRLAGAAVLMCFLAGCQSSPGDIIATDPIESVRTLSGENAAVGQRIAAGRFKPQAVDVVDPAGNVSAGHFRASYTVLSDGSAHGSFQVVTSQAMSVYTIRSGDVECEEGVDVITLSGFVSTISGGGSAQTNAFIATVEPETVGEPCIIWDIKDSCSHEAQGRFDILESDCLR